VFWTPQDRSFTFILKTPPTAVLLKKAAGEEKHWGLEGSKERGCRTAGQEQQ
jgi:large subunit ribosomal protein L11